MRRFITSITPILSHGQDQQFENKKISYWLEKLFNQARDKEKRDREQTRIQDNTSNKVSFGMKTEQTSEQKGTEEAVKSHANKAEKNRQTIEDMVGNSNRILLKVSSVFPWDLFPSSIIVEETRLTI